MRIAVVFDNFGPYHTARLTAASRTCKVLGIEVAPRSDQYAWIPPNGAIAFDRRTLLEKGTSRGAEPRLLAARLDLILGDFQPAAVAIPGWSSPAAALALEWCNRNRVAAVVMSESQAIDRIRHPPKEWLKRRFLKACGAALVGGRSHRDYLVHLGMPADRVFLGYDVVDNDYFLRGAEAARSDSDAVRKKLNLPQNYFLASNRFIPKKNLPVLLRAFAKYRAASSTTPWDLVLLGDGPLRPMVESLLSQLHLEGTVHLPGFKQYDELPAYYGLAGAFVHASTTEQWGLVVNEAMASGLPVIVSNRCGCVAELVRDGENGFLFDPNDEAMLANLMGRLARDAGGRAAMAEAGRRRIAEWGPERFAQGLQSAADCALRVGPQRPGRLDSLMLRLLAAR